MTHCGCVEFLIVVIFIVAIFLFLFLRILFLVFIVNKGGFLIRIKILNVRFFRDFELLLNVWGILFLFMVVMIRRSVIIFSFSYIRGLFVNNFVLLYLSFVIRMLWLVVNNNFYWIIFG